MSARTATLRLLTDMRSMLVVKRARVNEQLEQLDRFIAKTDDIRDELMAPFDPREPEVLASRASKRVASLLAEVEAASGRAS